MLRFEQCTAPLLINGAVTLLERLLQVGHLGKAAFSSASLSSAAFTDSSRSRVTPCRVSSAVATSPFRRSTSAWSCPLSSASLPH